MIKCFIYTGLVEQSRKYQFRKIYTSRIVDFNKFNEEKITIINEKEDLEWYKVVYINNNKSFLGNHKKIKNDLIL